MNKQQEKQNDSNAPGWEELTPTVVSCLACGGVYEHRTETRDGASYHVTQCRWCTAGAMSREQVVAWTLHKSVK